MFNDTLTNQEHNEVVSNEDEVFLVHVDVAENIDQVMYGLRGLQTQELLQDSRIGLLNHSELLISRVLYDVSHKLVQNVKPSDTLLVLV